jgi:transcription termination factor Rho
MAEEQLERSILENKERDELHAIAAAMSLKPGARLKKADIIDLILQATGVGADATAGGSNGGHVIRSSNETLPALADEASLPARDDEPVVPPRPRRAPRTRTTTTTESTVPSSTVASSNGTHASDESASANGANGNQTLTAPSAEETNGTSTTTSTDEKDEPSSGEPRYDDGQSRQNGFRDNRNGQGQGQGDVGNRNGAPQGDLGNRRSRRRRGRDRERPEFPQGGNDAPFQGELVPVKGLLDLRDEGYGFLRTSGYLASPRDVYVSVSQARRFALRRGDAIEGACRPAGPSEKYPALIRIDSVCGLTPDEARLRPKFEDLTPLFPDERLRLEMPGDPAEVSARIVDLISPIGKGQRGMIVSPPKAGKTTVMKQIAHSIEANNPDVHLIVLLVDERPEEVTDMRRSVRGEVVASTFDRPAEEHTAVAELTIERAKRLVELGRDVVIILDGITRLARAYNLAQPTSGRIMSGGVDSGALYPPKKFFGAARNIEEGGSLTILATALVETGSRMDEVIFEEFKGTGNMELRLDRKLAERRLYPAIDVNGSSTRHEELLFDRNQLQQVWKLRRVLNALGSEGNIAAGLELLMDKIRTTRSNDEFLAEIAKAPVPMG